MNIKVGDRVETRFERADGTFEQGTIGIVKRIYYHRYYDEYDRKWFHDHSVQIQPINARRLLIRFCNVKFLKVLQRKRK
jgi:hypothetical protein